MVLLAAPAAGAPQWTLAAYPVSDVYTYGEKGVPTVFLEGHTCRNQKEHFLISPTYVNNAKQLTARISAVKADRRVRFYEDFDIDTRRCHVNGTWIKD